MIRGELVVVGWRAWVCQLFPVGRMKRDLWIKDSMSYFSSAFKKGLQLCVASSADLQSRAVVQDGDTAVFCVGLDL